MSEENEFNMYKNIVNNYFRISAFEKAKELCVRDMVQLNQRYITEAVCRNEALNRADKLQKELDNSISKDIIRDKIKELKNSYSEHSEFRIGKIINILEELLGE